MISLFKRVFGSRNQRVLRKLWKVVDKINGFEAEMKQLSGEGILLKTQSFRDRLAQHASLDSILPEAYALVREASRRVLNMRHFDVQLIGGMVLNGRNIAEMKTGEGKTLMSTLSIYLNALSGKGVHLITINDYLVRRDAEWMRPLYEALGLTVGVNVHGLSPQEKQAAYRADITYGTNNEFGFDYLRDNMVFSLSEKVQRGLHFAIVDEVDSILIDEARTPLIISGAADDNIDLYLAINAIIPQLTRQIEKEGEGDYSLDEKSKQAFLTEAGHQRIEESLLQAGLLKPGDSLYDAHNIILMHHIYAALRAHKLFNRDIDYIVQRGEVIIVDEHTGRTMPGRRWSEGLHQAIEAKENVRINQENQTLASITFQNYFRLYEKLAGMTGTADTEAYEFQQIYGLEVVVIPTHRKMIRVDHPDMVFLSTEEKLKAIVADIKTTHTARQPILVGTASIESSEHLSALLKKERIPHTVLNAKFHEKEAEIIADAGRPKAVTIATNMAGRGTDIVLGGNLDAELKRAGELSESEQTQLKIEWQQRHDDVVALGGLYVLGTERHESRRIDNQLRGRSGRQGDPGKSRFYLSMQDNLLRIFGGDRLSGWMKNSAEQDMAIESKLLTRIIEGSQRKVEAYNFDVRKQLLEFDDVANEQRRVIYSQRNELLECEDISDAIDDMRTRAIDQAITRFIPPHTLEEEWDVEGLTRFFESEYHYSMSIAEWLEQDLQLDVDLLTNKIQQTLAEHYVKKQNKIGAELMRHFEKAMMLQTLDMCWREHLAALDYLRQGIHLRGYAQKNPKQEYKREAFALFASLIDKIDQQVIAALFKYDVQVDQETEQLERAGAIDAAHMQLQHANFQLKTNVISDAVSTGEMKVARNALCPCGSGLKYKHCHGELAT